MALITKAIKGTKDVLPKDVHKNQYIEATALDAVSYTHLTLPTTSRV